MDHSEQKLIEELEAHIRRVIANPQMGSLNVADQRGGLANALRQYIDKRVKDAMDDIARKVRM